MYIVNRIHKLWITCIRLTITLLEQIFFYPKLRKTYIEMDRQFSLGLISRNITVFDVGANRGQSVIFFKKLNINSKIYAFEPQITTYNKLVMSLRKKRYTDVQTLNIGISQSNQRIRFYESILDETSSFNPVQKNSSYFRLKSKILFDNSEQKSYLCDVVSLDSFMEQQAMNSIDILKIDVEGHEFEVLNGVQKNLKLKNIALIQLERHEDNMRANKSDEIDQLLRSLGYEKFREIKHAFGRFYEDLWIVNDKGHIN